MYGIPYRSKHTHPNILVVTMLESQQKLRSVSFIAEVYKATTQEQRVTMTNPKDIKLALTFAIIGAILSDSPRREKINSEPAFDG